MKPRIPSLALSTCLVFLMQLTFVAGHSGIRPKRDHLTRQEADMLRDTQELDKRINVLIKAAERRAAIITSSNTSQAETELWGEIKGTRADLLYDISMILDEAITNIDDVSGRDERNPLIPKSIRKLAEASTRIIAKLLPLGDKFEERSERRSYEQVMENAASIIEAAGKLPPPSAKSKKKSDNR